MRENAIDIFLARFESRFDDVRDCYKKLTRYFESVNDAAPEATELNKVIGEVLATFKNAIRKLDSARDEKQLTAANEAYEGALGGENREAKFMAEWRKFTTKVSNFVVVFRIFADPSDGSRSDVSVSWSRDSQ